MKIVTPVRSFEELGIDPADIVNIADDLAPVRPQDEWFAVRNALLAASSYIKFLDRFPAGHAQRVLKEIERALTVATHERSEGSDAHRCQSA